MVNGDNDAEEAPPPDGVAAETAESDTAASPEAAMPPSDAAPVPVEADSAAPADDRPIETAEPPVADGPPPPAPIADAPPSGLERVTAEAPPADAPAEPAAPEPAASLPAPSTVTAPIVGPSIGLPGSPRPDAPVTGPVPLTDTGSVTVSEPVTEPIVVPVPGSTAWAAIAGPPGGTPPRPAPAHQRPFWFGLMLAVAVTLAGASFVVGAYVTDAQPETVVRSYFTALADGDAAAALGYGTVPDGPHDLLTDQVLAAQNRVAPITDFAVDAVRRDGEDASVDVRYTLSLPTGRNTVTDTVRVARAGGGWRLVDSAVSEQVERAGGSDLAIFAGSQVPAGHYLMFPGAVPAVFTTPNLVLSSPSRVVRFVDDGSLLFNADLSPAGRKLVGTALDDAFDRCLAGKAPAEVLCPLPDAELGVPGTLLGRPTAPPGKSVTAVVSGSDGRIDLNGTVSVAAHYQRLDTNNLATRTDVTTVQLRAHTYATAPTTIIWDAS